MPSDGLARPPARCCILGLGVATPAQLARLAAGDYVTAATAASSYTSTAFDIGAKLSYQGATLVGYYYDGEGLDSNTSATGTSGLFNGAGQKSKDSGGYVQATFVVPGIGTKLGASWGVSNTKAANGTAYDVSNESWIVGAYHPLTKSLNLVAEYTSQEIKDEAATAVNSKRENDTVSLGAILFF